MSSRRRLSPHASGATWQRWLVNDALPLWAEAGYDQKTSLFQERLSFSADPVPVDALRLMVQARQVATYCRAACESVFNFGESALRTLHEMERLYHGRDGQPGWIFSVTPNGAPADTTRDLYAHAFVTYAYHWAYRLSGDDAYSSKALATLQDIERIFADRGRGLRGTHPTHDPVRGQDPLMHLFEACLAWMPHAKHAAFQQMAERLVQLALDTLIDASNGMLREYFDEAWQPLAPVGSNRVEPGHVFEWAWLLREFCRIEPMSRFKNAAFSASARLFALGCAHGLRNGAVIDAIDETGVQARCGLRVWPQTEYYRLLSDMRHDTTSEHSDRISIEQAMQQSTDLFFRIFAPSGLNGGWIDRLSEHGERAVDYMPASSLYHIYGAATAA